MKTNFIRIAVIGGIAVGKSTIVNELSTRIKKCQVILEDVSKNVFLEDFYSDMRKYAFHSRISTLSMITANYLSCDTNAYKCVIFDRCIDELITFAKMHYDRGNMSNKEFEVYQSLYKSILSITPPIDLYIYCKCSTEVSLERIKKRNRPFEQNISNSYIDELNMYYEKWLEQVDQDKLEIIDTNYEVDIKRIEKIVQRYIQ